MNPAAATRAQHATPLRSPQRSGRPAQRAITWHGACALLVMALVAPAWLRAQTVAPAQAAAAEPAPVRDLRGAPLGRTTDGNAASVADHDGKVVVVCTMPRAA